jgi:signal transduction histidine kinase
MPALVVLVLICSVPQEAHAYVPHDYSAIYTHQIGNIYYSLACLVFLWTILRNGLQRKRGWRYIFLSVIFFLLWDVMVFVSRIAEVISADNAAFVADQSAKGWNYFRKTIEIHGIAGYLLYVGRFDFLILIVAQFLFYQGLQEHLHNTIEKQSSHVGLSMAILPMAPIYLTEICGNIIFLVITYQCLRSSVQLYRKDRENILWSYMVWLSASLLFFAFSRSFGHIWRHILPPLEIDFFWSYLEAIFGSLNTAVRFVIATLTFFFIWIYQIYRKMTDDKRKIEEVSADIMNLNQEMEDLGAERTFALLGLRIADNIRNPVSIIGCVVQRMLKQRDISDEQKENLVDVLDACHMLEQIVSDFESIIKNRPRMFHYEDVNEVVKDIVKIMEPEARQRGILFHAELSEKPAKINLQRNLLRVGLFYLMRNAMHTTSSGGKISVQTCVDDEFVTIRISDSGCGLTQDVLQHLFDPLYNQSGDRLRMALPLVRQIVKEHLGELLVSSQPGKGTTFEMIFPVKWCILSKNMGS